jgi:hypothetical protein
VEFRILGSLDVVENGHPVPLGGSKQRALLASLLLHANEVVSRDRLIDELWGASPPATAPTALQVYVSQLRKALGRDLILTQTWRGGGWRRVPARRAAPARRRRDQLLEAMEVELPVADADEVARGLGEDQIPAEGLAQLGDVHLERGRGGLGR